MKLQRIALAAAAVLLTQAAQASDGTITFNGQLTTSTCTITGGGNQTVTLPTLSTATLATNGATAGDTLFKIDLTSCTASTANAYFEAGANTDASTGRLKTNATNLPIQLLNASGTPINVAGSTTNLQNTTAATITSGSGSQSFIARYFATGATTAGAVTSSVTYSMVYN